MTLESRTRSAPPRPSPCRNPGQARRRQPPAPPATADNSWDAWFDGESVTADFLVDRDQPTDDAR